MMLRWGLTPLKLIVTALFSGGGKCPWILHAQHQEKQHTIRSIEENKVKNKSTSHLRNRQGYIKTSWRK